MRRYVIAVTLVSALAGCLGRADAGPILNADLVGGTSVVDTSNALGWTISGVSSSTLDAIGLFDGVTANPGNGRVQFKSNGSAVLSSTNYISILGEFLAPQIINSLSLANDFGDFANSEITSMELLLNGSSVGTWSGFNDNDQTNLDLVFAGATFGPVSTFEVRLTGSELGFDGNSELREVILDATVAVVPEPTSLILFGIGGIAFAGYRRRRKRNLSCS